MPQQAIRQRILAARRALTPEALDTAGTQLLQRLQTHPNLPNARHVAAYIAIRGEMPLAPTLAWLHQNGTKLYLPILRGQTMHFCRWEYGQALVKKDMGLWEPAAADETIHPSIFAFANEARRCNVFKVLCFISFGK